MLKSHFDLQGPAPISEMEEEEAFKDKPMTEYMAVEEEHPSDDEKPVTPPQEELDTGRILKKSEISIRLSLLGLTAEGDGYTYLKATCTGLGLTNIEAIKCFSHLQYVDLSNNLLGLPELQPVTELPYLVLLKAAQNELLSGGLNKTKYLQVLILNKNKLTTVYDVFQPELNTLEAGENKIQTIEFLNKMTNLKCLDFRDNIIEEIKEMNCPNLDSLYLANNRIKSLVGIEKLVNLRILHVRNNPIKYLYGFDEEMVKLQYLNLRNTKISTLRQIRKLKVLPALDTIVLRGSPYMGGTEDRHETEAAQEEEELEIRIEIIATLPKLKRINKNIVNDEERREANNLMMQWLEEGDKDEDEEFDEGDQEEQMPEDI